VWGDFFRLDRTPQFERLWTALEDEEDLCTCGVVLSEVFQGVRWRREYRQVGQRFAPLLYLPTSRGVYMRAAGLCRRARDAGKQPKSTIDCVIAACASAHEVPLLHHEAHFEAIAEVSKLQIVACS